MPKINGLQAAIEALKGLDAKAQEKILAEILKKDPVTAAKLRDNMFTFDDLPRVNPQGLVQLFKDIPDAIWVLAFRGKKDEFIDPLVKVIAKRRGDVIKEALKALGPQPQTKVAAAQKKILDQAVALQKQGKLVLAGKSDPLV